MMKRLVSLFLLAALLSALPGCGPKPETTQLTFDQIVQAVLPSDQPQGADLVSLGGQDPEELGGYLLACYGLEQGQWTDAAVYRRQGAYAYEIAVVLLAQDQDAEQAAAQLEAHRLTREGAFTGYAPDQAELARRGVVAREGQYLALLICGDPEGARERFYQCFGVQPPAQSAGGSDSGVQDVLYAPYAPPGEIDMTPYDTSAILAAWRSGDEQGLSQYDREILTRCRQVLDEVVSPGMDAGEQELAVYRWLTLNVDYDADHYSDTAVLSPDSSTPYGPLVNGKGICLGYASTFQLLMDLLDIECITVIGAAYADAPQDHAWNMVRLDGAWYCADPTWDLTDWEGRKLTFFNVTSEFMAWTDHQWDYKNTPVADTVWTGPV